MVRGGKSPERPDPHYGTGGPGTVGRGGQVGRRRQHTNAWRGPVPSPFLPSSFLVPSPQVRGAAIGIPSVAPVGNAPARIPKCQGHRADSPCVLISSPTAPLHSSAARSRGQDRELRLTIERRLPLSTRSPIQIPACQQLLWG